MTNPSNAATSVGLHESGSATDTTWCKRAPPATRLEPALSKTSAMYGYVAFRSVPLSCAHGTRQRQASHEAERTARTRLESLAVANVAAPAQHVGVDELDDGRRA